ncbi:GntR family transcriptional regulator [Kitasatospora sp. SolWspMP-SS2h]|uniref:GntR family transcriptional regulator n=1 Tax=Kitasatospora sp. SolWspMP-SS2h TaxID=1305729 RepID=UPI000DB9F9DE|nr:GntR family transcriptional regulator [Kitasatospora sp. SolWspMP-SS2h]
MSDRSPRGTYLQIAEALRAELDESSGPTTLPSEAELMARYGVARTTVGRALKVLADEGLIRSRQGARRTVAAAEEPPTVYDQISGVIAAQGLEPGDEFPSESDLCKLTDASRGTVRRALAQLEGAGVLEVRRGKGRFIRALPGTNTAPPTS